MVNRFLIHCALEQKIRLPDLRQPEVLFQLRAVIKNESAVQEEHVCVFEVDAHQKDLGDHLPLL